jgi:hypothetical protein
MSLLLIPVVHPITSTKGGDDRYNRIALLSEYCPSAAVSSKHLFEAYHSFVKGMYDNKSERVADAEYTLTTAWDEWTNRAKVEAVNARDRYPDVTITVITSPELPNQEDVEDPVVNLSLTPSFRPNDSEPSHTCSVAYNYPHEATKDTRELNESAYTVIKTYMKRRLKERQETMDPIGSLGPLGEVLENEAWYADTMLSVIKYLEGNPEALINVSYSGVLQSQERAELSLGLQRAGEEGGASE